MTAMSIQELSRVLLDLPDDDPSKKPLQAILSELPCGAVIRDSPGLSPTELAIVEYLAYEHPSYSWLRPMLPHKAMPLIVRRQFFDEFAAGTKTIEYRRHRGQFTARAFWPGRRTVIAYRYDHAKAGLPHLDAVVRSFEVQAASGALLDDMRETYPDMREGDEVALIGLRIER